MVSKLMLISMSMITSPIPFPETSSIVFQQILPSVKVFQSILHSLEMLSYVAFCCYLHRDLLSDQTIHLIVVLPMEMVRMPMRIPMSLVGMTMKVVSVPVSILMEYVPKLAFYRSSRPMILPSLMPIVLPIPFSMIMMLVPEIQSMLILMVMYGPYHYSSNRSIIMIR